MQDYRLSFHITGLFGCIFSLLMFIPAAVEYFTGMVNFDVFMNSAFFGLFVSLLIVVTSYTEEAAISHRSSFLATTLVWFVITFITAVPLYFARYPGYSISIIDLWWCWDYYSCIYCNAVFTKRCNVFFLNGIFGKPGKRNTKDT